MEAGGEAPCRGDADRGEVCIGQVRVCLQGTFVPSDFVIEVLLEVGQVVRDHAPLGVVTLRRELPAGAQRMTASALVSRRASPTAAIMASQCVIGPEP